jgi:hypothetical protein
MMGLVGRNNTTLDGTITKTPEQQSGLVLHRTRQFLDSLASDRRDNAELGKVSSDRIDHRGLLADE